MQAQAARRPTGEAVFTHASPIGALTITTVGAVLAGIHFGEADAPELPEDHAVRAWLDAFFAGTPVADVATALQATPFQQAVLEATRSIPRGEVRTYGWVAAKIGRPRAARAVGQALGANPLPLIIPCHRVVGSDGAGGYGGGLDRKAFLLALERSAR